MKENKNKNTFNVKTKELAETQERQTIESSKRAREVALVSKEVPKQKDQKNL